MKRIVLIFLLFKACRTYDFVRDALNSINQNSDPCDDFFRHACPMGNYHHLISEKFKPIFDELIIKQRESVWENSEYVKALNDFQTGEATSDPKLYLAERFQELCENDDPDKTVFISRLQHLINEEQTEKCYGEGCLKSVEMDGNCTRAALILEERLERLFSGPLDITKTKKEVNWLLNMIRAINVILDGNYRSGVDLINTFMRNMIHVLSGWIQETPWVNNNNASEAIQSVAEQIVHKNNYAENLEKSILSFMEMEHNFLKCSLDFSRKQDFLCFLYAEVFSVFYKEEYFSNKFGASNSHPLTRFANQLYAITAGPGEMAGKLGLVGLITGHELSHSLIEDPRRREYLPISSEEAIQCIQNQFNATCEEFREKLCEIDNNSIDENGADILGLQLAYQLFEDHYNDRIQNDYIKLSDITVTYQQLFFYASAFAQCSGTPASSTDHIHSVNNIRANVVAQHPAFKEAFQCSSDSRMMQTVERQCIVYGEKAPERRKKFQRKLKKHQKEE